MSFSAVPSCIYTFVFSSCPETNQRAPKRCLWIVSAPPAGTDFGKTIYSRYFFIGAFDLALLYRRLKFHPVAPTARNPNKKFCRIACSIGPGRNPGSFDGWLGIDLCILHWTFMHRFCSWKVWRLSRKTVTAKMKKFRANFNLFESTKRMHTNVGEAVTRTFGGNMLNMVFSCRKILHWTVREDKS